MLDLYFACECECDSQQQLHLCITNTHSLKLIFKQQVNGERREEEVSGTRVERAGQDIYA